MDANVAHYIRFFESEYFRSMTPLIAYIHSINTADILHGKEAHRIRDVVQFSRGLNDSHRRSALYHFYYHHLYHPGGKSGGTGGGGGGSRGPLYHN